MMLFFFSKEMELIERCDVEEYIWSTLVNIIDQTLYTRAFYNDSNWIGRFVVVVVSIIFSVWKRDAMQSLLPGRRVTAQ